MAGRVPTALALALLVLASLSISLAPSPGGGDGGGDPGPTDQGGGGGGWLTGDVDYEAFPPIFLPHNSSTHMVDAFYPNTARTGYLDATPVQSYRASGGTFADLNGDGHLDYVCANRDANSQIFWGNGSGTWSNENTTDLVTEDYTHVHTGDFNGDGELDIVFSDNSSIFLNKGGGEFNSTPDINLPTNNTIGDPPGDLNNDGIDDVVVVQRFEADNKVYCYFGGPGGPDKVPDITLPMGERGRAYIDDVDRDGFLDIVVGANIDGESHVYLGGEDGPDTTVDYRLAVPGSSQRVAVGDINDDGYVELLFSFYDGSSNMGIRIFKGGPGGWNVTGSYDIPSTASDVIALELLDVDLDGYDDILAVVRGRSFQVYFGDTTWPTSPGIVKATACTPFQMAVAASRRSPVNATRPSAPLNLTATAGDASVSLEWEPPEDTGGVRLLGYHIYRGPSENVLTPRANVDPDTLTWRDGSCVNGRTYHYGVTAINFKGESYRSNVVNATPLGRPEAPGNLTVTAGCGTVGLEWDPPPNTGGLEVLGYLLQRGTTSFDLGPLVDLDNLTTYTDDAVENGRTYYYRLCAFNELGNGAFTPVLAATPLGPPTAPWNLQVDEGDGQVTLSWREPQSHGGRSVQGYRLYRGMTTTSMTHLLDVDDLTTSWVDADVINGVTYLYQVLAYNEIGDGPRSVTVSATPYGLPGAPVNLTVEAGRGQVTLAWEGPGDDGGSPVFSFQVHMGTDEGPLEPYTQVPGTTCTITGLQDQGTYHFRVAAVNLRGEGPLSGPVSATLMPLPTTPTDLVVRPAIGALELGWTRPADTGGMPILVYRVYRGEDPDSLALLGDVDPASTSYVDDQVEFPRTYWYSVSALTEAGEGPRTPAVSGTPLGPPGPPTGLQAAAGDGRVDLVWAIPGSDGGLPVSTYIVLRGDTATDLEEVARVDLALAYADNDVENGRAYHYAVVARNDAGDGPPSGIVEARPERVPVAPGPPLAVKAMVEGGRVTLTWSAPDDDGGSPITGYLVLRGASPDDLRPLIEAGTALSVTDGDARRGKTYHYCVIARNRVGQGERSQVVSARLGDGSSTVRPAVPWLLLTVLASALLVVAGGVTVHEPMRFRWGLLVAPLFSRMSKDDVLDNKTRLALHGSIIENPGIHYSELLRMFNLSNGAAAYHLNVLIRENFIRSVSDGHMKRFYSRHTKVPRDHRMTPEEVRAEILSIVTSRPGISQKDIVDELGRDRATVGYHLREMVKEGNLVASREGQYTVYRRRA